MNVKLILPHAVKKTISMLVCVRATSEFRKVSTVFKLIKVACFMQGSLGCNQHMHIVSCFIGRNLQQMFVKIASNSPTSASLNSQTSLSIQSGQAWFAPGFRGEKAPNSFNRPL